MYFTPIRPYDIPPNLSADAKYHQARGYLARLLEDFMLSDAEACRIDDYQTNYVSVVSLRNKAADYISARNYPIDVIIRGHDVYLQKRSY